MDSSLRITSLPAQYPLQHSRYTLSFTLDASGNRLIFDSLLAVNHTDRQHVGTIQAAKADREPPNQPPRNSSLPPARNHRGPEKPGIDTGGY